MLNPRFFKILRCPVPRNYHFFSRDSHTFCFVFMHSHISPNVIQFHYFFFISFNYVHTSISRGIFHFMGNYHQDKSVESIRHQHPGKATSKNLAPTHTQNFGVSLGRQNITKAISTKFRKVSFKQNIKVCGQLFIQALFQLRMSLVETQSLIEF